MRDKVLLLFLAVVAAVCPAQKRLVLVDQDGSGPGGSNQMAMLALLQAPNVQVLGITMVTGNAWRDEETLHTLRMLELTGHSDVPVARGAVFPLVRTEKETLLAHRSTEKWSGSEHGVKGRPPSRKQRQASSLITPDHLDTHGPYDIPPMKDGRPALKPIEEDAVHFLIRQVRAHPHEVTIYAAGPLTNIALAIAIDREFAGLTKGIVMMGGSLNPQTDDPEFATNPGHEFNFWFDPEATDIVLRADWPRIDVTTVDVSLKAAFTQKLVDAISKGQSPAAKYIASFNDERYYMWDELAACAWLDPTLITKEKVLYMDVDLSHGPSYGNTLTWSEALKPTSGVRLVHAQMDVDLPRFEKMFVELMTGSNGK